MTHRCAPALTGGGECQIQAREMENALASANTVSQEPVRNYEAGVRTDNAA
jgi:hypothetical protein